MNEQGVMPDEQFEAMTPEQAMQNIDNYIAQNYGNQIPDQQQQQQQQEQFQQEQQNFNGEDSQQQYAEQPQQQEVNPEVYKEAYDYIMQPFKAAGKEFQLRDFHEARGLMQQGIDYTKKQQALKPRLMEMRTLENNGMLGDNLNYAIDFNATEAYLVYVKYSVFDEYGNAYRLDGWYLKFYLIKRGNRWYISYLTSN
jgi:hypothetical protein